jgi:hypothetical protein
MRNKLDTPKLYRGRTMLQICATAEDTARVWCHGWQSGAAAGCGRKLAQKCATAELWQGTVGQAVAAWQRKYTIWCHGRSSCWAWCCRTNARGQTESALSLIKWDHLAWSVFAFLTIGQMDQAIVLSLDSWDRAIWNNEMRLKKSLEMEQTPMNKTRMTNAKP